jgi:hypothetical protein
LKSLLVWNAKTKLDAANVLGCFKGVSLSAFFQITRACIGSQALFWLNVIAFDLDGEKQEIQYHTKSPPLIGKNWMFVAKKKTTG